MLIGVPAETRPGETRVAATAETVKKLVAGKHSVLVQSGAGLASSQTDEMYVAAGAQIGTAAQALGAEMVLKVRSPSADELAQMNKGAVLIGMLEPFNADGLSTMNAAGLTAFALEAAPRTTRAQSMDVLSSQANIAGSGGKHIDRRARGIERERRSRDRIPVLHDKDRGGQDNSRGGHCGVSQTRNMKFGERIDRPLPQELPCRLTQELGALALVELVDKALEVIRRGMLVTLEA